MTTWQSWAIIALVVFGFSDFLNPLIRNAIGAASKIDWKWGSATGATVTAQQAFQAAEYLADFKKNAAADPAYPLVMAALDKLTKKTTP